MLVPNIRRLITKAAYQWMRYNLGEKFLIICYKDNEVSYQECTEQTENVASTEVSNDNFENLMAIRGRPYIT